jgi:hypothetical protein
VPRAFNGTTDTITASAGGLSGFGFGAFVVIARRTNESGWHGIVATQQSGGTWEAYLDIAPSAHATASAIWTSWNGTDHANTLKFTQADGWCIVAATKATGTATPRYHKCVLSSRTWTHDDGVGTVPNATSIPGGNVIFGNVAGDQLAGDVAAVALYGRTFTDQELESFLSWEVWLSYGPMGAWLLDQAVTAQSLLDWTGGGANQSAISGTTVQTASLPGWNQSDGGIWVAEVTAAGGTDATVSPSTVAAVAAVPAVTVTTGSIVPAVTVAAVGAVPTATPVLGTLVGAGTVAAVGAVPAVTLRADANLTGSTVAATGAVPTATPSTGETVTASTVAAVAAVPATTLHTGEIVNAVTVVAVAAVPTPSVATGGSTNVAAVTVVAVAAITSVGLSTGERVTASTVAAVAAVPAVTVRLSVLIVAATVAATTAIPAANAATGTQVAALTVAALAAVPPPTIAATAAALVGVLSASIRATSSQTAGTTRRTGGPT